MPIEFKDYYATLGLTRSATDDEIKKAFRGLARKYHPDVAKDKRTAEEKFKEINEAYEVLGDPEKRKRYDRLGARWQEGERPQPPPGRSTRTWRSPRGGGEPEAEFNFGGSTGFSDFFEQFFGRQGRPGAYSFEEEEGDAGYATAMRGQDVEGDILVTLDEVVHGSERTIALQRVDSRTGQTSTQTLKVRIPIGITDGQTIRVRGKGGEGVDGGVAGDLLLHVRLAAHPDFRVDGADLHVDLPLAPWEAVLGATESVPTLTGRINLRVPPGTDNGQKLRVRGQGLPKNSGGDRGDLYVRIAVRFPPSVTEEERELWEKLRRISRFDPRA